MIKNTTITLLLLSGSIFSSLGAEPQAVPVAGSSNQIRFVQVHLEKGQMTLVKSTRATGVLKTPRGTPNQPVMFSLESTNGTSLWNGWMADPSIQRVEYTDANEPEVLKAKTLTNDPVDFVVRVPQASGAEKLSFYRLTPPLAKSAGPAINSQPSATIKELMGSVVLPPDEE
jgi:hypothetical protein